MSKEGSAVSGAFHPAGKSQADLWLHLCVALGILGKTGRLWSGVQNGVCVHVIPTVLAALCCHLVVQLW